MHFGFRKGASPRLETPPEIVHRAARLYAFETNWSLTLRLQCSLPVLAKAMLKLKEWADSEIFNIPSYLPQLNRAMLGEESESTPRKIFSLSIRRYYGLAG
jgi:hypothetical protein